MRQWPRICPLIRTVLPKEALEGIDIGIGGRIIRHKQLVPALDCGSPVTQRLFCCSCLHRHAPDTSAFALDRQQPCALPRLHGSRIKTADLMDAQTYIVVERGNMCRVIPDKFPTSRQEEGEVLSRQEPVSKLKRSVLQRRLI